MKMLRIDPTTKQIFDEIEVYSTQRVEGMYYKTEKGMIPLAYLYPLDKREQLEALLKEIRDAEKVCEDIKARIYYQELPKLRE
jgi:hypothetical protein